MKLERQFIKAGKNPHYYWAATCIAFQSKDELNNFIKQTPLEEEPKQLV